MTSSKICATICGMDIKQFFNNLNRKGIVIPLIRYKGQGSLSATVFFLATFLVVLGFSINMGLYICAGLASCEAPTYFPMTELLSWFGVVSVPYMVRSYNKKDQDNEEQNDV